MGSYSKAKSSRKKTSKIRPRTGRTKRMKRSRSSKSKKVRSLRDTSSDESMSSQSISSASNDSYSLYSDSDSMSSVSFSSSSEDTYGGKKKVSRLKSKLMSTRKGVRRRHSSSKDLAYPKKRKRSRKNADLKSRKKSRKDTSRRDVRHSSATSNSHFRKNADCKLRKKSRRKVRHSSVTSDSHNYSTCKSESASLSDESEAQKHFSKFGKNKRNKRESREEGLGTKKRSHRSSSSSSYSRSRDQNYSGNQGSSCSRSRVQSYGGSQGDTIFVGEHNSRRLRSVIIFAEQEHEIEVSKSKNDSLKEEIIYDRDDYPSPRSNDSSSGGSKRDVDYHSPVAAGDKRPEERVEGQQTSVSNIRVTQVPERSKNANDPNVHDPLLNEVQMNKHEKVSGTYGSKLGADDLEAVLRQKALENLKKFRGGIQRNVKANANQMNSIDADANESFSSKVEIVQRIMPKQDNTNAIDHVKVLEQSTRTTSSMGGVSYPHKDTADTGSTVTESRIAEQKATHPSDALAFSLNQDVILQSSPSKKLNEDRESEKEILPQTTNSVISDSTTNSGAGVNNAFKESASQGQGSNELKTESKDGAQFEQKTMSVMRGGEMVQVNYKVYIPKKAPALSRRQLKQ